LLKHDWLAVALLVVVAAPVGAVPGTTQAAWQVAACELQLIMQLVVVDDCARRIDLLLLPADALTAHPATANKARRMVKPRTSISSTHEREEAG
jgi:hypothetical protein